EICLPRNSKTCSGQNKKEIKATFLEYVDDFCPADGATGGGGGGSSADNNPPQAVDDSVSTAKNTTVTISVLGNDSDPDSDSLGITNVTELNPFKGTVQVNADGKTILYQPKNNDTGTYQFTYTISDGKGGTSTATVTVVVASSGGNNPPVAANDEATTDQNTAVVINVIANDDDPDGDSLSVNAVGSPGHGSVTNNGNGTVTYTPNNGFSGSDSFTYTVSDGNGGTATATVTITVTPANRLPVAANDGATTDQNTAVTINVLSNDNDPDGDSLTVASVGSASNGSVGNNGNSITYTPNGGFYGSDSFTYTVSDGKGGTATAQVSITVIRNNPPVANDDTATTDAGSSVVINVGSNDTEPDGDPLVFSLIGYTSAQGGSLVNNGSGFMTYNPPAGFAGTDTFTYQLSDGKGGMDTATVTVTVNAAPALHVASIVVEVQVSWSRYQGVATITVVDQNGNNIGSNATVVGTWTGPQPGTGSDATNSSGVAEISTSRVRNASGTYTFCVTNISKSGYTYDASANSVQPPCASDTR
ncbi:MAG: tandem-95 repeat protein, partial [Anaerolineae bacterium]|nr:tandem-95 repeat protein [Anaerolineae bacterium]